MLKLGEVINPGISGSMTDFFEFLNETFLLMASIITSFLRKFSICIDSIYFWMSDL
jgi:hypothetical protein